MRAENRRSSLVNPYQIAADLSRDGKHEQGYKIIAKLLTDNPMDIQALVTGSYITRAMGALPVAYHYARAATQLRPTDAPAWTNLGHAASQMWLVEEAERHYFKALECSKSDFDRKVLWVNLSALYLDDGKFDKAQGYIEKVLAKYPDDVDAKANLGFCLLAQRKWEGWKGYRNTIGSDWRPRIQYKDEPEWDGTPGKVVALYGDQGLGDEISFASMIPDAADVCSKVIVDCDERLEGLFRRSFPQVKVYGTRTAKDAKWDKADWHIDASLPLGQIGEYFRTTDESFPGTPYLTACPDRMKMWKALFAQKGKPVIGIAWTGGMPRTNARNRRIGLEDWLPIFGMDAHFVSLQYKDSSDEIAAFRKKYHVDLKQYPWGTLTKDYDDTAALIASLAHVVCIQTAVAHTAGALGVPVTVLVPEATQWRYGKSQDSIPWYESLRVVRQAKTGSWSKEIERTANELRTYFSRVPGAAGAAARNDQLRHSVHRVCAGGVRNHQPHGDYARPGLRMRQPVQSREEPEGGSQASVPSV